MVPRYLPKLFPLISFNICNSTPWGNFRYTKNFWAEVIKWLDNQGVKIEHLSDKDIMFGILRCEDKLFVNHTLIIAKQDLYSCRQNKSLPSLLYYLQ